MNVAGNPFLYILHSQSEALNGGLYTSTLKNAMTAVVRNA
jgi:hypothetical protein